MKKQYTRTNIKYSNILRILRDKINLTYSQIYNLIEAGTINVDGNSYTILEAYTPRYIFIKEMPITLKDDPQLYYYVFALDDDIYKYIGKRDSIEIKEMLKLG